MSVCGMVTIRYDTNYGNLVSCWSLVSLTVTVLLLLYIWQTCTWMVHPCCLLKILDTFKGEDFVFIYPLRVIGMLAPFFIQLSWLIPARSCFFRVIFCYFWQVSLRGVCMLFFLAGKDLASSYPAMPIALFIEFEVYNIYFLYFQCISTTLLLYLLTLSVSDCYTLNIKSTIEDHQYFISDDAPIRLMMFFYQYNFLITELLKSIDKSLWKFFMICEIILFFSSMFQGFFKLLKHLHFTTVYKVCRLYFDMFFISLSVVSSSLNTHTSSWNWLQVFRLLYAFSARSFWVQFLVFFARTFILVALWHST